MKYLKINEWAKLGNLFWDRVGYFRREQSDEELIVSFCDKYLQQFDEYESSDNSFTYIDALHTESVTSKALTASAISPLRYQPSDSSTSY